jgi:DNA invertase Pin-like site-specific DNA recombinase
MKVGYARTSTAEQMAGLDAQLRDLRAAGVEKIFQEQLSSVKAERAQLAAVLDFIREGDVLIVTKLDRLARSIADLVDIGAHVAGLGASLQVLDPAIDTSTSIGRLMFNVIGAVAQFEREIMLERQREGIAKAKASGRYRGRQPTARRKLPEILRLAGEGLSPQEIHRRLDRISLRSVQRLLAEERNRIRQTNNHPAK